MAERVCAICGRKIGMFEQVYGIRGTNLSSCKDHLDFSESLKDRIMSGIDTSDLKQKLYDSLESPSEDFWIAVNALEDALANRTGNTTVKTDEDTATTQAMREMLMTTGYDFQGYRITKYINVFFDELIVGLGLSKSLSAAFDNLDAALSGSEAKVMSDKLTEVKATLRDRVKMKAVQSGANALIGIDFESSSIGDLIMVSMTATAVVVEKIE